MQIYNITRDTKVMWCLCKNYNSYQYFFIESFLFFVDTTTINRRCLKKQYFILYQILYQTFSNESLKKNLKKIFNLLRSLYFYLLTDSIKIWINEKTNLMGSEKSQTSADKLSNELFHTIQQSVKYATRENVFSVESRQ